MTLTSSCGGSAPHTSTRPTGVLAVLLAAGISFALSQTIVLPALLALGGLVNALAGLLLAPSAAGQLLAGPVAGRLGVRIGFRATLVIGSLLDVASFGLLAALHDAWWHLAVGGLLLGAGVAFAFASMANLVVAAVGQSEVGIATGINTVTRTLGGACGSAVATAVLASTAVAGGLPSDGGYRIAFGLAAGLSLLAAASALRVPRNGSQQQR